MNIKIIVHTLILTSLTLILFERFYSCYSQLVAEPTAFEERIFDNKTTFPSFTLCPHHLEDERKIESFEDVVTEIQYAKTKYTGQLSVFKSRRGYG